MQLLLHCFSLLTMAKRTIIVMLFVDTITGLLCCYSDRTHYFVRWNNLAGVSVMKYIDERFIYRILICFVSNKHFSYDSSDRKTAYWEKPYNCLLTSGWVIVCSMCMMEKIASLYKMTFSCPVTEGFEAYFTM
jgi:hypothetical protein